RGGDRPARRCGGGVRGARGPRSGRGGAHRSAQRATNRTGARGDPAHREALLVVRSEEHTSELQSRFDLVCRLLLEKKKEKVNDIKLLKIIKKKKIQINSKN